MILKLISLTIFSSLIILLLNQNFVKCVENNTSDDYVYDYGSDEPSDDTSAREERVLSDENSSSDDFVYDYGSGQEVNSTTAAKLDENNDNITTTVSYVNTSTVGSHVVYDENEDSDTSVSSSTQSSHNEHDINNKTSAREETLSNDENNSSDDYVYDYGSGQDLNSTAIEKLAENNDNITTIVNNVSTSTVGSHVVYDDDEDSVTPVSTSTEKIDKSHKKYNKNDDDYDSDEEGEQEGGDSCNNESLLDKIRDIHEEGKNLTFTKHVKHINETFDRIKYVRDLYQKLVAPDKRTGLELLAFVSGIDVTLSPECFASFFAAITGYRNSELWATKFVDSTGRFFETGTADGKHSSFGEYDGCLEIESPDTKGLVVKGQYCMVKVILPFPSVKSYKKGDPYDTTFDEAGTNYLRQFNGQNLTTLTKFIEGLNIFNGSTYRLGLCVPHLCKPHEVETFLNKMLYPIIRLPVEVGPKCDIRDKTEDFTILQLISMSVLIILSIIVITSTGIEIYNIIYEKSIVEDNNNLGDVKFGEEEPLKVNPYYYAFSLVTNTRSLYTKNNRFAALDTIRLFVILHVYVLHLYNVLGSLGIVTLKRSFATYPSLVLYLDRYTTLRNTLLVDILFTMSGFILANGLLGKLEKTGGKFNYINYIINRWFRFSIPLLGSILFFYLLPLLGSGPIWDYGTDWVMRGCESPLVVLFGFLYISNFNDQFGIMPRQAALPYCNPPTWFISALFQLHIIIPIFIIIYYKSAKKGMYAIVGALIIGMLVSVSPTIIFGIVPQVQYLQIETFEELFKSFVWYYMSTNAFIVSFLVGVIGGYLLRKNIKLNIEHEVILWILTVLSIILVFMWNNTFWKLDKSAPLYSVLLWYTFGKLFFAAAFTWIFFALCTGRAQIMNNLLSWSNFQPFARLSFGFYMIHFMVVIRRIFTTRETILMTDGLMIENSIIDFMVTFCLAYLFYALIEAPFSNLMTLWLRPKQPEVPQKNGVLSNSSNQPNWDYGHSNDIELEENIGVANNVEIDISGDKTIKI